MRVQSWCEGPHYVLYDADAAPGITQNHFETSWWQARQAVLGTAPGRASVAFVRADSGSAWALRHYRRGGLTGRVIADTYFWNGLEQSRPWREWKLTAALHEQGLPVPQPIAARVRRSGLFYQGDLITRRIESAQTLADRLAAQPLTQDGWRHIGAMLRRFHDAGVRHDDINARNILLDAAGGFYLIDFDKAAVVPAGAWREQNLARFKRSLEKFKTKSPAFRFSEAEWTALIAGYDEIG